MPEYIEREAAIKAQCYDCGNEGFCSTECDAVISIRRISAADVREVVKGKWIDAIQNCGDSPHVKCSVCGEYYWRYFKKFNYCPNCGADMRPEPPKEE